MPLFDFTLKPFEDIDPFSDQGEPVLIWFGLTDAYYHVNVGDEQLFRYTPEIEEYWYKEYPDNKQTSPVVDYNVIRLYEDLFEILPNILQPLPDEIHAIVSTRDTQDQWFGQLRDKFHLIIDASDELEDGVEDNFDELHNIYLEATGWWGNRQLPTSHLKMGPDIWIWRYKSDVYIRWDCTDVSEEKEPPFWTAGKGEFKLSLDEFLEEIHDFHDRLMSGMAERIEQLKTNNPIPHIRIDLESVAREHEVRIKSLDEILLKTPSVKDWDAVMRAYKDFQSLSIEEIFRKKAEPVK
ncbi:MAG: DUF5984 family protein [Halopseudomonas aestusnigri]